MRHRIEIEVRETQLFIVTLISQGGNARNEWTAGRGRGEDTYIHYIRRLYNKCANAELLRRRRLNSRSRFKRDLSRRLSAALSHTRVRAISVDIHTYRMHVRIHMWPRRRRGGANRFRKITIDFAVEFAWKIAGAMGNEGTSITPRFQPAASDIWTRHIKYVHVIHCGRVPPSLPPTSTSYTPGIRHILVADLQFKRYN